MVCCELTETDALYIRLLGTLSRHRRKGVAKAMMARVMQEADRRDIHNVYTFVRVDNKVRLELEIIPPSHWVSGRIFNTMTIINRSDNIWFAGGVTSGQEVRAHLHGGQQDRPQPAHRGEDQEQGEE